MPVKILILGSAVDRNLIRLINNIKLYDTYNEIIIDVLHTNSPLHNKLSDRLSELTTQIRELYVVKDTKLKNPIFKKMWYLVNLMNKIRSIEDNGYDLVNIHYMSANYFPMMRLLKRKAKKIMITPWGSDVYRVKGLNSFLIKQAYKKTDYVSWSSSRFKYDVQTQFSVPDSKLIELSFGSVMIDLINSNSNLLRDDAKKQLNISGHYVIVCGYNASAGQQHLEIIKALSSIKDEMPINTILLFPMTYARNEDYVNTVKEALSKSCLNYILYEDYLNDENLLYLRKSADMFIHVQITDAFSASVQEFLLCDTKVINGEWLRYPDLEKWGVPYAVLKSMDNLGETVKKLINGELEVIIPNEVKKDILLRGYKNQTKKWISFYLKQADNI